ncbi:MAG TPA: Fic family protein [Verrucomicrobiae bacterium]|nr:Fic family protein [Verrucomicrobiae bacterium]
MLKPIRLPEPKFTSPLVISIWELEKLRYDGFEATTPPWLFFDLKQIMHLLESVLSVRIEGNRTTLYSAVEDVIEGQKPTSDEQVIEWRNVQKAIEFIEQNAKQRKIDRAFLSELHKIVVADLSPSNEGSRSPGVFRRGKVKIDKSAYSPPDPVQVTELMDELFEFIDSEIAGNQDLLVTAIAHHRFEAIHPFDNGNGRTGRLLTYAMLTKQRFIDTDGLRLLNPSAIFGVDRRHYFQMLSSADTGTDDGLLGWCEYVVNGIKAEVSRIDKLMDFEFVKRLILGPSIKNATEKGILSKKEKGILEIAIEKERYFQAGDVMHLYGASQSARTMTSRALKKMRDQNLILALPNKKQQYVPRFFNNLLLRGVMQQLNEQKVLPLSFSASDLDKE